VNIKLKYNFILLVLHYCDKQTETVQNKYNEKTPFRMNESKMFVESTA